MAGISVAKSLELVLLRSSVTDDEVVAACQAAAEMHLACISVFPVHVRLAARELTGCDTRVSAAISIPFGHETTAAKLVALDQARSDGADEVAVALDHHALVSGAMDRVKGELDHLEAGLARSLLNLGRSGGEDFTVIIESMHYSPATIAAIGAELEHRSVGFVQTSSGFQTRAVTEDHIRLLRDNLPQDVSIKAVGGVGDLAHAQVLMNAGAVRIGTQGAVSIAHQEQAQLARRRHPHGSQERNDHG